MRRTKTRKTDAGTGLFHLWLVVTMVVSVLTGLRFAADMSDSAWLRGLAPYLPTTTIWIFHMFAGVSVMALAAAYPLYLALTGLGRRVALDRARLSGLMTPGPARWSAFNVLLYWFLFACLGVQLVTGLMLFRGHGGAIVEVHLLFTWLIIGYAALHVLAHFAFGGFAQLMRVVRPAPIPVALAPQRGATPWARRGAGLGVFVFGLCALVGVAIGAAFLRYDLRSRDVLQVLRVPAVTMQDLQSNLSDAVWRAPPLVVRTNQGANFDGAGASAVEIRAVHDDEFIGLAIAWDDPTRSLKHAPLMKQADGWHALFTPPEASRAAAFTRKARDAKETLKYFEDTVAEDKFSIMINNVEKPFGPGAFHPGEKPLRDKPPSSSGRGLHYTEDGSTPNIWLWHANGAPSQRCENVTVGGPATPTSDQIRGLSPYKGGVTATADQPTVLENFTPGLPHDPLVTVTPVRLPRMLDATRHGLDATDLNPDYGDDSDARWRMTEEESEPYSRERDARIPLGTIIPGLIAPGPRRMGPRDVYCSAKWAAGRWMLLVKRRLNTGHAGDMAIGSGTYMWVAAFDHTIADHTRHIRPIRLELR